MSTAQQAADAIKGLSQITRKIATVGEYLESIASLEQALNEATRAHKEAREAADNEIAVAAQLRLENDRAAAQTDELVRKASADVEHLRRQAHAEADRIEAAAREQATALLDQVQADFELARSSNAAAIAEWSAARDAIKAERDALAQDVSAKRAAADELDKRLESTRESIKRMLGK